jgi:hypothetical protein
MSVCTLALAFAFTPTTPELVFVFVFVLLPVLVLVLVLVIGLSTRALIREMIGRREEEKAKIVRGKGSADSVDVDSLVDDEYIGEVGGSAAIETSRQSRSLLMKRRKRKNGMVWYSERKGREGKER